MLTNSKSIRSAHSRNGVSNCKCSISHFSVKGNGENLICVQFFPASFEATRLMMFVEKRALWFEIAVFTPILLSAICTSILQRVSRGDTAKVRKSLKSPSFYGILRQKCRLTLILPAFNAIYARFTAILCCLPGFYAGFAKIALNCG